MVHSPDLPERSVVHSAASPRSPVKAAVIVMAVVALLAGCSSDDATPPPTTERQTKLDHTAACEENFEIIKEVGMADAETAGAMHELADRTSPPDLAAEFERIADAFDRGDENIPVADDCS